MIAQFNKHGDRVTVLSATEFIAVDQTPAAALEAMRQRGLTEQAAIAVLERIVTEYEYRETFLSAAAAVTKGVKS